jgi:hypothetical protein
MKVLCVEVMYDVSNSKNFILISYYHRSISYNPKLASKYVLNDDLLISI